MNDITPKEAIEILRYYTDLGYGIIIEGDDTTKIKQALSLASKMLANGTPYNPTGDAISREALKKDIEAERHNLLARGQVGAEHILVHHCLPIIDNAPTVPQINVFCENADEKAVADLKAELQSVIEARPQGEWISRSELLKHSYGGDYDGCGGFTREYVYVKDIENAQAVEYTFEEAFQKTVCENRLYCPARPKGEWRDNLIEVFRQSAEVGGDMFHLSEIERIINGEPI